MTRIAVTELEHRKGVPVWKAWSRRRFEFVPAPPEEEALAALVRREGVRHVILGVERYEGALYDALQPGGVVARFGVGHDGIDKARATRRSLLCTNTPGVLDDSVAEYTVALMIAAARGICALAACVRDAAWTPRVGMELRGKTLATIGCGAIGRRVAQIAATGLGMRVIGCELLALNVEEMKRDFGYADIVREFDVAVRSADFVSLHIPSTPLTRHFINEDRLAMMPSHAWLLNTARGAIVDEHALFNALRDGVIAGAALDVFAREPYEPVGADCDLRTLPNVILTPHVASSTQEACNRTGEACLRDIVLAEEENYDAMHLLNPEVVPRLQKT